MKEKKIGIEQLHRLRITLLSVLTIALSVGKMFFFFDGEGLLCSVGAERCLGMAGLVEACACIIVTNHEVFFKPVV